MDDSQSADLDLGWTLAVVLRAYLQHGNDVFADLPGGPRGYQVLASAERAVPERQLDLARRLGIDRTVMTYLIDDLVAAGLVERRVDDVDRRARRIVATPKGRRMLPALDRRLAEVERRVLAGLSDAQADELRRLLRAAAGFLDRGDPSDDPRELIREMRPRNTRAARPG